MRRGVALAAGLGFLGCILAANYVTSTYGMVPVGFGLVATAGTYFAGLTFVLRDVLQDTAGKLATFGLIWAGAALSIWLADPRIAIASAAAFVLSELADLAVYTPLRRRGYVRAAVASNAVGAVVDSLVFLWVAGFPILDALAGQVVGKLLVTAAVVALVVLYRRTRRPLPRHRAEAAA
jgi:queuosine precursor transporter